MPENYPKKIQHKAAPAIMRRQLAFREGGGAIYENVDLTSGVLAALNRSQGPELCGKRWCDRPATVSVWCAVHADELASSLHADIARVFAPRPRRGLAS